MAPSFRFYCLPLDLPDCAVRAALRRPSLRTAEGTLATEMATEALWDKLPHHDARLPASDAEWTLLPKMGPR